jgi:uncharacterized protein YegP (UPF0339 family)
VAFELYEDDGWGWRLVDEDRREIGTAASHYESREAAETALEDARDVFADASVLEIDSAAFEFHHTDGGWRWRLVNDHGEELAESLATFDSRAEAQEDLSTIKELGPDAWISTAE